jgi:putative transposase
MVLRYSWVICTPDSGPRWMLDFRIRIGIREGPEDEEKSTHRGSDCLRQAESGTPVEEIIRKLGIAEQTFYRWKKRHAGLGVAELRRLRQVEDENRRLKRLVADLTLDKQMLQDALSTRL